MYKSIVASCDTYYYVLASETDIDDTWRFMSQLGFGRKTGIDIEASSPACCRRASGSGSASPGRTIARTPQVVPGRQHLRGIGQGYNSFTPIQLAHAMATVANDGVAFRPHLVKSIRSLRSGEIREIVREPSYTVPVKPEHVAFVKNALVGVAREGTAARAFAKAA